MSLRIVQRGVIKVFPLMWLFVTGCLLLVAPGQIQSADLVAHWPLDENAQDRQGSLHAAVRGDVKFGRVAGRLAAEFNGRDAYLQVSDNPALALGEEDFSLSLWVNARRPINGIPGDLVNKWDSLHRRGLNLYLSGGSSAYSSISDARHVHFSVDDAFTSPQRDHGKPSASNSLISNLVVYQGSLYAGISDATESRDAGRVFRFVEGQSWEDCGRLGDDPTIASVMSLIVHDGRLYAGTGRWDWIIANNKYKDNPPPNTTKVYVYEGNKKWKDMGEVGKGARVMCLASFNGMLFAGLDRVGEGHVFRLAGDTWIDCGVPDGRNVESMMPWDGHLYVSTHGNIYRYDADGKFVSIGIEPHGITQIHSMHVHTGKLVLGTWPQGYILRYASDEKWDITGRVGLPPDHKQINEINALIYHGGKMYAGTIPLSEVYRYEHDGNWERLTQLGRRPNWLEASPDSWMRVVALASYQGRLFAGTGSCRGRAVDSDPEGTLGRITSFGFGQMASYEDDLTPGWVHLTAVRRRGTLETYVNGKLAAKSHETPDRPLNITTAAPLRIGFGDLTYFNGALAGVRLYRGALSENEITELAR